MREFANGATANTSSIEGLYIVDQLVQSYAVYDVKGG